MTFDEWLDEIEVYSTRRERLIEGLVTYRDDHEFVIKWLRAAYDEGVKHATNQQQLFKDLYTYPKSDMPTKCSRCGISLTGVMGFVCSDAQCPTFARITCT